MAKSNEDGTVNGETLSVDTLANLFGELNGSVIIYAGPLNDSGKGADAVVDGFTVPMLIPRDYGQYAKDISTSISTNWHKKELAGKSVAERVAYFEQHIATEWEPKDATLRSPIEQAAYDRILANAIANGEIAGNASVKVKNRRTNRPVAKVLNDPTQTERGRPVIEAFLAKFRDYDTNMTKRNRRDENDSGAVPSEETEVRAEF